MYCIEITDEDYKAYHEREEKRKTKNHKLHEDYFAMLMEGAQAFDKEHGDLFGQVVVK